jgi:hypothetical protein
MAELNPGDPGSPDEDDPTDPTRSSPAPPVPGPAGSESPHQSSAAPLDPAERAELERLRQAVAVDRGPGPHGVARGGRWAAAIGLLVVAAVLGGVAVVAVYLRAEVLNTDAYVQTVAPLGQDPVVRTAVAQRLTDELITRSDLTGLANQLAGKLESEGGPARLSDLVGPLVSGVSSFLNNEINKLMETQRFATAWDNINRAGHQGLVTVLTGGSGKYVSSQGDTVTLDLGALLSMVKQQLVSEGLTIFSKIPDVSIPYTLVQSDQLPKLRNLTRLLDAAGTWLPWLALLALLGGILIAPNRRRGIITGCLFTAAMAGLLLAVVTLGRSYYVDNLPPAVRSPDAAAAVISTLLRFLVSALQTLLVVMSIFVVGALLAGPSRPAVFLRRWLNRGLDGLAGLLRRAGGWVAAIARVLRPAHAAVQIGLVLLAVVGFVLAERPGIAAVLWTTFAVLVVLVVLEVFVRAGPTTRARAADR